MGSSRDGRYPKFERPESSSAIWKSWNIDKALSSGYQNSRERQREISQFLKIREQEDEIKDLKKELKNSKKTIQDLKHENEDLTQQLACSKSADMKKQLTAQGDFESKVVLREVLSNFRNNCSQLNRDLMENAEIMFPEDFPRDISRQKRPLTFTQMIKILVDKQNHEANRKDQHLLSDIESKLDCLLTVATDLRSETWRWLNPETGKQFFILCKSVAQWNNDTFHSKIKGLLRIEVSKNAEKGLYSVEGVDLGPVVKELLHVG